MSRLHNYTKDFENVEKIFPLIFQVLKIWETIKTEADKNLKHIKTSTPLY